MGVALTPEGKSLIARLQAEGKALIIDRFLFAHIAGQEDTAPPATNMPENVVHSAAIPAEYRGYVTPSQVVYSAMLGSDVGDFSFNWQGLYCTEHGVIVAVATFPALQKRAYDAQTNTPGNNLTRNFILEFSGAQELTGILIEAEVWQIDFTVRLRGIDERERLSNFDVYGEKAFFGDAWRMSGGSGVYTFSPGIGYVGGIRAALYDPLAVPVGSLPCDVWLDVSMPRQGSDVITEAKPLFLAVNAWEGSYHAYQDGAPFHLKHYCSKIAHIDAAGTVTVLRQNYDASPYRLGEFYSFRNPVLLPGFYPRQGGILANAATIHPDAWAFLQTTEGQTLCKTEAEWQGMNTATWATLADGTKVGWDGIGGVPFYAPDWNTGSLRLPDTRGMSDEDAGDGALGVGGVHGDAARRLYGAAVVAHAAATGKPVLEARQIGVIDNLPVGSKSVIGSIGDHVAVPNGLLIDSQLTTPVAAKNQTRAWGALACVYLGAPA